jgi:hypothetical protein
MNSNSVHNRILKLREEEPRITVRRLRTLTLTNKNTPMKIWGTTIKDESYSGREVFTFQGPSRNPGVPYNYNAKGYMVMYDMNKGDYRTFVYNRITHIELNGIKYKVI